MYAYMHVRVYACMYVFVCMYCMYVCLYVLYTCMYVSMHVYVRACVGVCLYVY